MTAVRSLRLCLLFRLAVGCSLELVGGGWGPPPAHSHRHGSIAQHVSVYLSCKQRTCRGLGQSWSKLSHKIGTQEFVGDTST